MTITPATLARGSGLAAAVGGILFLAVQINHPPVDTAFVTTTEYTIRESVKMLFAVFSLAGITGMYLTQLRPNGVLGFAGYLMFSTGFLVLLSTQVIGIVVLPTLSSTNPQYVNDVAAVATDGVAVGDVGLMQAFSQVGGGIFVAGAFLFGIALFRANVLARWASGLLAVGAVATLARAALPEVNFRLFAVPIGVALVGLGYSLWRERGSATPLAPDSGGTRLELADGR